MASPNLEISEDRKDKVVLEAIRHTHADDTTVQQDAYFLYLHHTKVLKDKVHEEMAELRQRQDKIKFIHEVMQEINNLTDNEGMLNLKAHPELKEKLKQALEMGIKLPVDKDSFDTHARKRLVDNLSYSAGDWEKEDSLQMRRIQTLYNETEQSLLIAKDVQSKLKSVIDGMAKAIRGG